MSVGFQNPISGSYNNFINRASSNQKKPILGGGLRGFIPQATIDSDNGDSYAQTRFTLRNAWNAKYINKHVSGYPGVIGTKRIQTPFRVVTNSGDDLSRPNYSCGGSCQTFQSRPGLSGLRSHFGAIQNLCDGTGVPPSSCNVKYVYDSSDYTTYLKQRAVNRNYNAVSNGGDEYSGSQSAWRAIRRY